MAFALVTGASGGIGLDIARELGKRKIDLLLVARSEKNLLQAQQELTRQYGVRVEYLGADLSNSGGVSSVLNWISKNNYQISILVNNAGYGIWGSVENTSWTDLSNMMNLNMVAVVELCHSLLPELKKHNQSYILNVASTASYQAIPTLATYAASKAFVLLFTRGLRRELKKTNVSVTCLSPGATSTNFVDRAGMNEQLKTKAEKFSMKSAEVASIAVKGMFSKRAEIIPGFINWFSVQMTYFVPKAVPEGIAEGLYKTKA
ncbi:MAG TPA: SDR family oxidoreductase [Cyclobacteriaceae bacterium]|jgi:short-subunit dehydrogenase|nr:SDR family oxidoreductase [Cyclobacteriaceae bacterium]